MDIVSLASGFASWLSANWTVVVPAVIVAQYGFNKYNEPDTNRFCTTGLRFWTWRFVYIGLLLILTLSLAFALNIPTLRAILFPGQTNANLPAMLLAALVIIGSLKLKAVKALDEKLLSTCQAFGYIPFGAITLARSLTTDKFVLTDSVRTRINDYVNATEWLEPSIFDFFPGHTNEDGGRRFARNIGIMADLNALAGEPRYQKFFASYSKQWNKIIEDVKEYIARTRSFFAAVNVHDDHLPNEAQVAEQNRQRERYRVECLRIYDAIVPFLSLAVHGSELTRARVIYQLNRLGFTLVRPARARVPVNSVVFAITVMGLILIVGGLSVIDLSSDKQRATFLMLNAVALGSYAVAILSALLIKRFRDAPADDKAERSAPRYAASGAVTAVLCYLLQLAFMAPWHGLLGVGFTPVPPLGNIIAISALLSVIIAYECDDGGGSAVESPTLRFWEGVAAAAILPAAMFVMVRLLPFPVTQGEATPGFWQIFMFRGMLAGVGFTAGAFIPCHYRRMRRRDGSAGSLGATSSVPNLTGAVVSHDTMAPA